MDSEVALTDVAIAAGTAGVFLSPVLGPFELIKVSGISKM